MKQIILALLLFSVLNLFGCANDLTRDKPQETIATGSTSQTIKDAATKNFEAFTAEIAQLNNEIAAAEEKLALAKVLLEVQGELLAKEEMKKHSRSDKLFLLSEKRKLATWWSKYHEQMARLETAKQYAAAAPARYFGQQK